MKINSSLNVLGIRIWTVAAGPEGQAASSELKGVAYSPGYSIAGGITAMVQKQIFNTMTGSLMKGVFCFQWCKTES